MSAVLKERPTKRYVYLELDLCEFSNDDLRAELKRRRVEDIPEDAVGIEELFLAMKFGKHQLALELLREYLMNATGRVLP